MKDIKFNKFHWLPLISAILQLSFLFILDGCSGSSSGTLAESERELSAVAIKAQDQVTLLHPEAKSWLEKFQAAQKAMIKKPEKSCELYQELSEQGDFPLKFVAQLRVIEICKNIKEEEAKEELEDLDSDMPKWFRSNFVNSALEISHQWEWTENEIRYILEKGKLIGESEASIKLYKKAFKLAQKIKNVELTKQVETAYFKAVPRENPVVNDENILAVAKDWENERYFKKAIKLYKKVIKEQKLPLDQVVKAYQRLAYTYKKRRDNKSHEKTLMEKNRWLKNAKEKKPDDDDLKKLWAKSQIQYARAVWTAHNNEKAQSILLNLSLSHLDLPDIEGQVQLLLGLIAREKGEDDLADKHFKQGLYAEPDDIEIKTNLSWYRAWNLYTKKEYAKAADAFSHIKDELDDGSTKRKFQYWEARSKKRLRLIKEANDLFENILETAPWSYYGILAHREMNIPLTGPRRKVFFEKRNLPTLEWLLALDFKNEARNYLGFIAKQIGPSPELLSIFHHYKRVQWYSGPIYQFFKIPEDERLALLDTTVPHLYPKPFMDVIKKYSRKYRVSKEFTLSIIRQESAYNTNARSWVDAFGVMQLTPELAKRTARKFKLRYKRTKDLYNYKLNIPIGMAHLKQLIKKTKNDYVLMVSGYNAGSKVAKRWKDQRFGEKCKKRRCTHREFAEETIEFIENIPYEETRNYVKLVFRNWINYKRLNSKSELIFPDRIFRNFN